MLAPIQRFVAVDWSGAQSVAEQRRRIVTADVRGGSVALSAGRTREATTAWLVEQAAETPLMTVGLDFSFSLPAWFIEESGASSIEEFWELAGRKAEEWLAGCQSPFWGRRRKRCPQDHRSPGWRGFRQCERRIVTGGQPKSTFQVGGAGSVGTGFLRGIPTLLALRRAGFSIWPFDEPTLPMAVEIYPRSFTGPVHKSSLEARTGWLRQNLGGQLTEEKMQIAAASEDAFDALCSAIGLQRQQAEVRTLARATDAIRLLEGDIFPGRPIYIAA